MVTASLTVNNARLLYQQSTQCAAELRNGGRTALENINPANNGGSATIQLTDTATGTVTTYRSQRPSGGLPRRIDLAAGQSLPDKFFLTDRVQFPAAGSYEMRACYEWGGGAGDVCSDPVAIEVIAANPCNVYLTSAKGGPSELYAAVWLHAGKSAGTNEIWLSQIRTGGKPMVPQSTHLADVKGLVQPIISVPPNSTPLAQWVAWLDENRLNYLLHTNGEASATESVKLDSDDWRIVPPVLQQPEPRGGGMPGADIVLHSPGAERVMVVHLRAGSSPIVDPTVDVAAKRVRWAQTAYVSSGKRMTYLLSAQSGGSTLHGIRWSSSAGLAKAQHLADLAVSPLGADVALSSDDKIFGAVFGAAQSGTPGFAFVTWSQDMRSGFKNGSRCDVRLPQGVGVERAVVRVDTEGKPYALLLGDSKNPGWYFARAGDDAAPLEVPAESKPIDIIFRPGDEPVVVFTHQTRGFQFHKPR